MKNFRKGQIVRSHSIAVLVTGRGDKGAGYPCFAGVVVKGSSEASYTKTGTYSDTWTTDAFEKTDIRINEVMTSLLNLIEEGTSC